MRKYEFLVDELVSHQVTYVVRAKSREEAREKALIGDTIEELPHEGKDEVRNREILEEIK